MPILNDRIVDQIDELLPEYINEEGQGLKKFLSAYFDFLEKGILIYDSGTELETIGLEDGEGAVIQETATFSPSPLDKAKFLYEQNNLGQTQTGSWEIGEYVVGSTSGATAMNIFPYCGGLLSSPPQTEIESAPGYRVCSLDL